MILRHDSRLEHSTQRRLVEVPMSGQNVRKYMRKVAKVTILRQDNGLGYSGGGLLEPLLEVSMGGRNMWKCKRKVAILTCSAQRHSSGLRT